MIGFLSKTDAARLVAVAKGNGSGGPLSERQANRLFRWASNVRLQQTILDGVLAGEFVPFYNEDGKDTFVRADRNRTANSNL